MSDFPEKTPIIKTPKELVTLQGWLRHEVEMRTAEVMTIRPPNQPILEARSQLRSKEWEDPGIEANNAGQVRSTTNIPEGVKRMREARRAIDAFTLGNYEPAYEYVLRELQTLDKAIQSREQQGEVDQDLLRVRGWTLYMKNLLESYFAKSAT